MIHRRSTLTLLLLAAGLAAPFAAAEPAGDTKPMAKIQAGEEAPKADAKRASLAVGDPAPAIEVAHWVKGEPVTGFEKGKVYVVEFWATWCPPCRDSIPHLTKLQARHKADGLTVIGISSSDKRGLEDVKPFVEKMGEKMAYVVAVDADRATDARYMEASGQGGIPTSFVVDKDSKIAWIGHPMAGLDTVVAQVIAGKFDAKAFAENEAKFEAAGERLQAAMKDDRADDALAAIDEMRGLNPAFAPRLEMTRMRILAGPKQDAKAAWELADRLATSKEFAEDAGLMMELARNTAFLAGTDEAARGLAKRYGAAALEADKRRDPLLMMGYASMLQRFGDLPGAAAHIEEALGKMEEGSLKKRAAEQLARIKAEIEKKGT